MSNILTGTADVTNGEVDVVWHGDTPLYAANAPPDSQVALAGAIYFLAAVTDTGHFTLTRPFEGDTAEGVSAEISPYTAQQLSVTSVNIQLATVIALSTQLSGKGLALGAWGLLSGRAAHDDETAGFVYLSLDGDGDEITDAVYFIKNSAASGDWSAPISVTGPQGPPGTNGVGEGGYGLPAGGAAGQLAAKASATDGDVEWIDPPNSALAFATFAGSL